MEPLQVVGRDRSERFLGWRGNGQRPAAVKSASKCLLSEEPRVRQALFQSRSLALLVAGQFVCGKRGVQHDIAEQIQNLRGVINEPRGIDRCKALAKLRIGS